MSPQGNAVEVDAAGVLNEAIEDGVADDVMAVIDGELTGDEGGVLAVSVLEHFEKVSALG